MIKRIRDRPQRFFVNADEERIIIEKMQQCGMENRSAYFRKMVTDGYVIKQDFDSLGKAIYELNKIGACKRSSDFIFDKTIFRYR